MAEALAKKKRVRAGHKASATMTMGKIDDILAADSPDTSLMKLMLQEKLETIKVLDSEIVELIDNEAAVTTEI